MSHYKVRYRVTVEMEQVVEAPSATVAAGVPRMGVYEGIPTSIVPAAVEEICSDTMVEVEETDEPLTPLPSHNRTITIEVEGGLVTDVYGLPDGWDYEVDDHDIQEVYDECEIATPQLGRLLSAIELRAGMRVWYANPPKDQPEQWATPRVVEIKSASCSPNAAEVYTADGDCFTVPPAELYELVESPA